MSRAGRGAVPGLAALLAAATGCADDGGDPSTLLTMPRLLAIAADPPVSPLDGAVALRALVLDAAGSPVDGAVAWRVCSPWQPVRDPDVDCAPDQALPLTVGADGAAHLALADVVARFGGPATPLPPPAPCAHGTVPVPVIATAVVDELRLLARKDVGVAAAPRRAPALATITVDGEPATTFAAGAEHRIAATPVRDSLDTRCTDDPTPLPVLESVRAHFYVTAGALAAAAADVTFQPDGSEAVGSVGFTAPTDVERVRLWTVLIDDDGGAAWALRELRRR